MRAVTYNQLFRLLAVIFLMWWLWTREPTQRRGERSEFVRHSFCFFFSLLFLMDISPCSFIVIKFRFLLSLSCTYSKSNRLNINSSINLLIILDFLLYKQRLSLEYYLYFSYFHARLMRNFASATVFIESERYGGGGQNNIMSWMSRNVTHSFRIVSKSLQHIKRYSHWKKHNTWKPKPKFDICTSVLFLNCLNGILIFNVELFYSPSVTTEFIGGLLNSPNWNYLMWRDVDTH